MLGVNTQIGVQPKSLREPALKSLESNRSKRLDPWSLDRTPVKFAWES